MKCPKCSGKSVVADVKHKSDETHRKKKCKDCGHVFYTLEIIADDGAEYHAVNREFESKRYKKWLHSVLRG